MTEVYLLLGTNEGKREENLESAIRLLNFRCGTVLNASKVYETAAWGIKEQNAFLNQSVMLRTWLSPFDLLRAVKQIEGELGRSTSMKWGPREIDIDILLYGNLELNSEELTIPHPYIHKRMFTLVPLAEIAPNAVHPGLDKSISELLQQCEDKGEVMLFGI